jgi:hypothetical protein
MGGVLVYMVGRGVMGAGAEQRVDLGMDEAKCWVEPLGEKITYG